MVATFKTDWIARTRRNCVELLKDNDLTDVQSHAIMTAIVMMIEAYQSNDPSSPADASAAIRLDNLQAIH